MKKKSGGKEKIYVCMVCKKSKKNPKNIVCCEKKMTAKDKGTWNA